MPLTLVKTMKKVKLALNFIQYDIGAVTIKTAGKTFTKPIGPIAIGFAWQCGPDGC